MTDGRVNPRPLLFFSDPSHKFDFMMDMFKWIGEYEEFISAPNDAAAEIADAFLTEVSGRFMNESVIGSLYAFAE